MTIIEQTKDLSTLSVIELMVFLKAYKQRLKRHDEDFVENVFQSKLKLWSKKKKMVKGNLEKFLETKRILEISLRQIKKNIFHVTSIKRKVTQRRIVGIVESQCHYCKKFRHMEKNCRNKNKHQANFVEEHDNGQHLFYATRDSSDKTGGN